MTERPILFSAPMVLALLSGAKTQTRRVLKWQPEVDSHGLIRLRGMEGYAAPSVAAAVAASGGFAPYGQPGDRLWVRETFGCTDLTITDKHRPGVHYRATDEWPQRGPWPWRPSIFMRRWMSRLTLEVTGVRVERLHEISEADAKAEGVDAPYIDREDPDRALCPLCGGTGLYTSFGANFGARPDTDCARCDTSAKRYRWLWESINGAKSWDSNPWVWVVEFKRVEQ